mmetsp:Transcript_5450/g.10396  ORF Transcript_5450/g.10396 Transcript_5450/m.10396 type:complete len:157 (-) Transcript_5450:145-615(-)
MQTVGNCSCRGLIDDTVHLKASDLTCIFGGLSLGIVEIGRDGDDSVGELGTITNLGCFFHRFQNLGADLLCRKLFFYTFEGDFYKRFVMGSFDHLEGKRLGVCLDLFVCKLSADEPFGVIHRVGGVLSSLVLCTVAHLNSITESDARGSCSVSLGI